MFFSGLGGPLTKEGLIQKAQEACASAPYMNCRLFTQLVLSLPDPKNPKLDEMQQVPLSSVRLGDVLRWGEKVGQHYAIYLGNGEVLEVEEWGGQPRVNKLENVIQEYDQPSFAFRKME